MSRSRRGGRLGGGGLKERFRSIEHYENSDEIVTKGAGGGVLKNCLS